jgi:plastocyanin
MRARLSVLIIALMFALALLGCTQTTDKNAAAQTPASGTDGYNIPSLPSQPENAPEGNIGAPAETPVAQPEAPAAQEGVHYVKITTQGFEPRELTISKGDKVIWTNEDSYMNTVTSDNGTYLKSNNMSPGDTYEKVFDTTGSIAYHSYFKDIYRGTVYVE